MSAAINIAIPLGFTCTPFKYEFNSCPSSKPLTFLLLLAWQYEKITILLHGEVAITGQAEQQVVDRSKQVLSTQHLKSKCFPLETSTNLCLFFVLLSIINELQLTL